MTGEKIVGKINNLEDDGNVLISRSSGEIVIAKLGDIIFADDVLVSSSGTNVIVALSGDNAGFVMLESGLSVRFNDTLFESIVTLLTTSTEKSPVNVGVRPSVEMVSILDEAFPDGSLINANEESQSKTVINLEKEFDPTSARGSSDESEDNLTGASSPFIYYRINSETIPEIDTRTHDGFNTAVVPTADDNGNETILLVPTQTVSIDTTPPTTTSDITAISDDTGTGGDYITSDQTLTIGGTNTALAAGERVQISLDNGGSWVDVNPATGTTWSYDNTGNTLAEDDYTFQTRVIDTAGNTAGATDTQAMTIDITAPTATSDITAISDDTGTVGDYITSDQTLTIGGTNTALAGGDRVQISLDNGASWVDVTPATGTTWSYDNTGNTLAEDDYTYQTRVIDTAGNTAGVTDTQVVTIDTSTPTATSDITAISDDTGTVGDYITSDQTLTIGGTNTALAAGDRVQISLDNGGSWVDVTPATGTTWSYDNTGNTLAEDDYTFQTRVIDTAGNTAGATDTQVVTIDTTAPTATSDITAISDDTGTGGDYITSDQTLTIGGTNTALAAGERVQISLDNGASWVDVNQATGTTWSYDNTGNTLAEDDYTFQTRVIDTAGNTAGVTDTQVVTIDTTAPTATSDITAISDDTGTGGDYITSDQTLTISGTNTALAAGDRVQISLDNGGSWVNVNPATGTTWSYDNTGNTLAEGDYTFQTRVIDTAGNTAGATDTQAVTIDITAPTATSDITAISDDTGTGGDYITSDQTLTISGTNTALAAGDRVQISLDNGASWVNVNQAAATTWSYDNTGNTLAEDDYTFQTRVIDVEDNTAGATDTQAVTIDITAPTATSDITAISDDTGTVGDYITSDQTLTIGGTNTALAAGERVQISLDNGGSWVDVTPATGTTWSYDNTGNTLAEDDYTFQTRVIDTAGNTAGATDTQAVTIDTTAPTATSDITAISDDTGTGGDYITSDQTLTIGGTNTALAAGDRVQISLDNGGSWVDVNQATATTWSYDNTGNTLAEDDYTFQTRVIDTAGNTAGVTDTQAVTIDITAPTATSDITAISDDTGTVGDYITSDQTLTIGGTNTALAGGDRVQISLDNGASWVDVTPATGTTWSYDNTGNTLAEDDYTFQTRVIDTAGNTAGATDTQVVTIDTTAPTATSDITAISDDTGTGGDYITSDQTLTIGGTNTALAAGDRVQISLDNGGSWVDVTPATGTTWGYDNTGNTLAEGDYTFQTRVIDTAGNTAGFTDTQVVTIDTTAPTATSDIIAISDDTGTGGDYITSDQTLTISGTSTALAAGDRVQISLDNGASWVDVNQATGTTWSYDNTGNTLTEDDYTFQTRVIDTAGNTAGATDTQVVTIDTTAPTATSDITAISDDTGTGGDYITSDQTLTIGGTNTALAAGERVQISLDNGGSWVDVTPATGTTWSYDNTGNTLAEDDYTFQTRVIDTAGNTAGATDTQAV
ncbi:MAG: hypothetical protein ACI8VC_002252, partial [Candidatus Endobugula sp.]